MRAHIHATVSARLTYLNAISPYLCSNVLQPFPHAQEEQQIVQEEDGSARQPVSAHLFRICTQIDDLCLNSHVGGDLLLSEEYTISWVYDEQYCSMPKDRAEIERTIVDFFHYLAQEGFDDISTARI